MVAIAVDGLGCLKVTSRANARAQDLAFMGVAAKEAMRIKRIIARSEKEARALLDRRHFETHFQALLVIEGLQLAEAPEVGSGMFGFSQQILQIPSGIFSTVLGIDLGM